MQEQVPVDMILKAIALAMAVASVILGAMQAATPETGVNLLGIGLFALALPQGHWDGVAALRQESSQEE